MYPTQPPYGYPVQSQYATQTQSSQTSGSIPMQTNLAEANVSQPYGAPGLPSRSGASSPARRPLPSPALPYRERSQTMPLLAASTTQSGQVPQLTANPPNSSARKPLPRPPSIGQPTQMISESIPAVFPSRTLPGLEASSSPSSSFTPTWQQYRRLGGGALSQTTGLATGSAPRRALPVPNQSVGSNIQRAPPPTPPSNDLRLSGAVTSHDGVMGPFVGSVDAVEGVSSRPSSASPPPPPLPPRPQLNKNQSDQFMTARSPSPSRAARKLPTVPVPAGVASRISAIESLRSFASPPPSGPLVPSSRTESISPTKPQLSAALGPTAGVLSSPTPTEDENARVATIKPVNESPGLVASTPSSVDNSHPTQSHIPNRLSEIPTRSGDPPPTSSPLSLSSTADTSDASGRPQPARTSYTTLLKRGKFESAPSTVAKSSEPADRARSPPPKFSSYISNARPSPGPVRSPQKAPQSMAMRMAALELEEEAARDRGRPLQTNYNGENAEDDDSETESSSESEPEQLHHTHSGPVATPLNASASRQTPAVRVITANPTIAPVRPPTPPSITISGDDTVTISISVPQINLPDGDDEDQLVSNPPPTTQSLSRRPSITISATPSANARVQMDRPAPEPPRMMSSASGAAGVISGSAAALYGAGTSLRCAGCHEPIVGRIVSAMNQRWHPTCFKCVECGELLEHVSSYEHGGRAYCHLDYHEKFAPSCYHCKTPIADERFITLDDPALGGQRYYHELHFFCAECGDPFLDPSKSSAAPKGSHANAGHDEDDVGFTVYRGHPYCESCHIKLRMPRCGSSLQPGLRLLPGIGCHKPINEGTVEAIGRRWHLDCFTCSSCKKPFEDPSFFQRGDQAFCDSCYRIIVKSEL